jgi:diguanylate cyclase (GGDEF)-like protein
MTEPRWRERRPLLAEFGYRADWSIPIFAPSGGALGALTLYLKAPRSPQEAEVRVCEAAGHLAGIAIERKLSDERFRFLASHDALTGLPNRSLLNDRVQQALNFAQRSGDWATVAFVDLDNFKVVNDLLGHNAGDDLLKAVSERMTRCLRSIDSVIRMGGDEFVVVLFDQPKSHDTVAATIDKVRAAVAEPLVLAGQTIRVTSSVGVASFPDDGNDPDTLIANADSAMYRAKELGRDQVTFFRPEINVRVRQDFLLLEQLRGAVAQRQFVLHYQPEVDVASGKVFAVEALLRWNHPTRGILQPDQFIPIAEQTGIIVPIGDWVLNEACRQNKAWQDAGLLALVVSVNVSSRQFAEKNFVSRVCGALRASDLEARYLELELTESLIMRDIAQAVSKMDELRRMGVQLAVDDFGIGYSGLAALKTFPITRLKIDKSFIKELVTNQDDRAVATAVISLGKKLNLRVVAEGVENEDQLAFLRENQCDEVQGFHFSKPIPPSEIEVLLRGRET